MICHPPGPCCPHSAGKAHCSHWKHSFGRDQFDFSTDLGGDQFDFSTDFGGDQFDFSTAVRVHYPRGQKEHSVEN